MMSADHSVFAETQQFFTKQRAAIEKLRIDNEALKEEMQLENKFSVQPISSAAAATIETLRQQSDACTQRIGAERARVADLQRRAGQAQAQVEEQRRKMGGLRAAQDCDIQLEKTMTQLENRLDKAIKRLNTRQAETRTLRDSIDGLRKERLALNEALAKLDGQLSSQRQDAARLLRISQSERLGRDKALASIAATRLAGDKEVANAEAEWRQLLQLIQQDRKQREVQRGKQLAERAQSTSKLLREDVTRGPRRSSRAGGAAADTGEDPSGVASLTKRLEDYAAAFDQISTATGTSGVEALVAVMHAKEDSNFRLFSYVGDINSEAEKLQAHADDVQKELDRYHAAADAQDAEHQSKLQALEQQGAEAEAEAQGAETREAAATARSEALKEGVALMWQRLGCEALGLEELLGEEGVTDTNLMQYLGIIEQRVNQLLLEAEVAPTENKAATEAEQDAAAEQSAAAQGAEAGWDPMKLLPSSLVDPTAAGNSAADVRPLETEAFRRKAQETLAARIADAQNTAPTAPLPRSRYNTTSVRRAPAPMRSRPMAKPAQRRR